MNCRGTRSFAGFAAIAVLTALSASADGFTLVRGGRAAAEIVGTGDRLVDEDIAYFTNAVYRATGALLPVVSRPTGGINSVSFEIVDAPVATEDRWRTSFPVDGRMVITGTRVSCRWELNRILEEKCGWVACFPGPHGTHWGHAGDIVLERTPHEGGADFGVQRFLYREDPAWERALGGKRFDTERCDVALMGHNVHNLLPPSKYGEDPWREKIMPLIDGERQKPRNGRCYWQPCYASEASVAETVKNACAYLRAHPECRVLSVSQCDGEGYCRCDACAKLNGGFDKPSRFQSQYKNFSNGFYSFLNQVAEGIVKEHPNVMLGCLAYCGTIDPPDFKLHPSLCPVLCGEIYQTRDPEMFRIRSELIRAWSQKAPVLGLWDYGWGAIRYYPPKIYSRVEDRFLKLKKECPSLAGYFAEGESFEGEGPKRYLTYRLLFDVSRDWREELRRWCVACVGAEAAPHLEEYYLTWQEFWLGEEITRTPWYKTVKRTYCDFGKPSWLPALKAETVGKADAAMAKVSAAVSRSGDAGQKLRASRIGLFHKFYLARIKWAGCGLDRAADGSLDTPERVIGFLDALGGDFGRAYDDLMSAVDEICRVKAQEKHYPLHPGIGRLHSVAMKSFRLHAEGGYFFTRFHLTGLIRYKDDPRVKEKIAAQARNPAVPESLRTLLRGMLEPGSFPRCGMKGSLAEAFRKEVYNFDLKALPSGGVKLTARRDGWCGVIGRTALPHDGHWYWARVTLVNGTDRRVVSTVSLRLKEKGALGRVELGPGAKGVAEVCSAPSGLTSDIELYVDCSGLKAGESVEIEKAEIYDLGTVK